ncbi:MAG: oligosaccharide flippase family protein [Ferruginibacter sp.]
MANISGILKLGISRQAKNIAIYTFANFFNKGVSFLLLFYFAHVLTENDFGMLNLFSNGILFLMPFISMGILQSASTEYFKLDKKEFKTFFSTTLLMPVAVMLLAIGVLFFFKDQLQQRYAFPSIFIIVIPVITLFNFLNEHLINMVRNSNNAVKYLFVNGGRLLTEIVLAVFFISAMGMGWTGRVLGIFISFLFVAGYAIFYFSEQKFIFGKISKKYFYSELQYSLPIILMQFGIFCMGSSAGYFIQYFTHDYAAVGIFSIAATFGSIILVMSSALTQYVYPQIYSLLSEASVNYKAIRKHFIFFAAAMLCCTLAVIIATPLAYSIILKPSYAPGLSYFYFICTGYFFWAISYFFYAFMLYNKEKKKLLLISLLSIILSFVLHSLFIKLLGVKGAAVSMCVTYFIIMITTIAFVYKEFIKVFKS